jgi:hypothetical protein
MDVEHAPAFVGRDLRRHDVEAVLLQHGQHQHSGAPRRSHADESVVLGHGQHGVRPRPALEGDRRRGRRLLLFLLWQPRPALREVAIGRHGRSQRSVRWRRRGGREIGGGAPREREVLLPLLQLSHSGFQHPDEADRLANYSRPVSL